MWQTPKGMFPPIMCPTIPLKSHSLLHSPVFDPSTGFGGPGTGAGGAVIEGPFASYNLSRGPGQMVSNHRLIRQFNHTMITYLTSAQVLNTTKQPTFERFRVELEGAPVTPTIKLHDAGHRLIGGDMGNTYSSPGGAHLDFLIVQ